MSYVSYFGGFLMEINEMPGAAAPLGVSQNNEIMNFAIFSQHAKEVSIAFFDPLSKKQWKKVSLDPKKNKTGHIWHIAFKNLKIPTLYAYFMNNKSPNCYNQDRPLLDPYAQVLNSSIDWKNPQKNLPMGVVFKQQPFDWQNISPPKIPLKDLIIYEMHVRGFTQDPSSQVNNKGKFLAIIEKIPYFLDLGINAIELMPIFEFDETDTHSSSEKLSNFWGYATVNFFSPMNRFASSSEFGKAKEEFKLMVRELHKHGIEVILDVVFNHTGESFHKDAYLSFSGIDKPTYYILHDHQDTNYSGCGNTMKLNHPVMQKLVLDCLHYWATEMQVDGFRFDLATIMNREMNGDLVDQSSLIKQLSLDPILSEKKLIAEPWDAAGGYQLGGFCPQKNRWSEWNDQFRNNLRKFIKGDDYSKNAFADHISGHSAAFFHRSPQASVNFISSHDGFTLYDLVAYNNKHNELNEEENKDGDDYSLSWNCGIEGDTQDRTTLKLREKQRKNFLIALMISPGIPMLLMGDEYGHTKEGNNNTWCQDNKLNYFLWDKLEQNSSFYRFVKHLITLRKNHSHFSKDYFLSDDDIQWHGLKPFDPNWNDPTPLLGCTLLAKDSLSFYIFFNPTTTSHRLQLPDPSPGRKWALIANTHAESPEDFYENSSPIIETNEFFIEKYSSIILKEH